MEDKESGSLSRKAALDILVELHRGGVTGSLKLERAPLQKAVYFRDGQILFAASNDPKDQLASILVEEGKLGPDQMQVAQARVSPGNPLAKVLTELGYISQRELADAARIKVEKILTDLYGWKEGTYQFATKSLPKGAIDLELSTARLLFASIRRVQDREWVLAQLGSLDSVLIPSPERETFIQQKHVEPLAEDVLRLADGVKSVKQIGAVSSLGEFEVCKILAAGLVVGCLRKAGSVSASEDAFAFPAAEAPRAEPVPSGGFETVGLPVSDAPQEPMSYDTVFQAVAPPAPPPVEESDKTVFNPPVFPSRASSGSTRSRTAPRESRKPAPVSDFVIDEPEPETNEEARKPPKAKKSRGGGGVAAGPSGILKWAGAAVLVAAAGFSVYYFVWPLLGGGGTATPTSGATTSVAAPPPGAATSTAPGTATSPTPPAQDPRAGAAAGTTPPAPPPTAAMATTSTSSAPVATRPAPAPASTSAPPAATTSAPRTAAGSSGAARPPAPSGAPTPGGAGGTAGRGLLRSGDLSAAARAFQQELQDGSSTRFTIALGLYCNEENVARMIAGAAESPNLFVLPASVQGRACYRVVWGLFDTREAAERSKGSLPMSLQSGDAAAVALSRFLR
jgi:hypothetical protein